MFTKLGHWFSDLWTNIDSGLRNLSHSVNTKLEDIFSKQEKENADNADSGSSQITSSVNTIKSKFGFIDNVKTNVNDMVNVITDTENTPKFTINVNSKWYTGTVAVIDFSWYSPYKDYGDSIICMFCYLGFLWNIFKRLPDIIQGAGASSYSVDMINDIQTYRATGFGRASNLFRR